MEGSTEAGFPMLWMYLYIKPIPVPLGNHYAGGNESVGEIPTGCSTRRRREGLGFRLFATPGLLYLRSYQGSGRV